MKVLVITDHDVATGCVEAVVELDLGDIAEEIYIEWLKQAIPDQIEGLTDDEILDEVPYSWCVKDITVLK